MSQASNSGAISVTPHTLWVPVPLSADPDEFHDELLEYFGSDDDTTGHAAMLTGVVRKLAAANAEYDDGGNDSVLNAAAWALLAEPEILNVRAIATLQVLVLPPDITIDTVIETMASGRDLFQGPMSQPIETGSGDAVNVRFRPLVIDNGESYVHEMAALIWQRPGVTEADVEVGQSAGPLPENSMWYVLSTYTTELSQAEEIGERLEELGAGIEGL